MMCYLTKFDDATYNGFWVILKITSANLYKPVHDIINYFTFICPFSSGKWKEGRKEITKTWISQNGKRSLDEI